MTRLDDLKASISNMTEEELQDFYRRVRQDRRVSKRAKRTIPKTKREQSAATVQKMVSDMTPEEKAKLLAKLKMTTGGTE